MYGPVKTSVLLLMLLHSSVSNQQHPSKQAKNLCMNAINENNSTQTNCTCEISSEKSSETRQLSQTQLNDLVNALENELSVTQDSNTDSSDASLNCGVAAYLDSILQRVNLTEFLMPYGDYRADLKMAKLEKSTVHQVIGQIKTSNYLMVIKNLVEAVLAQAEKAQKSNFTTDETYQLLAGAITNSTLNEQEEQLSELNQMKTFLNSLIYDDGLLQLLILVTMDVDIEDTSEHAASQHCDQEEGGLKWDETQQKCISSKLYDLKTEEKIEETTSEKSLKISTASQLNYSSTEGYETLPSAAPNASTKPFMHHPMTGSLKPINNYLENKITNNSSDALATVSSQQTPTALFHHKKHRKHNRKLNKNKMATATKEVPQSSQAASEPSIPKTSTLENSAGKINRSYKKKAENDKKRGKKSKKLIATTHAPLINHVPIPNPTIPNSTSSGDKDVNYSVNENVLDEKNNLDLLLPYLSKPKLPKGAILWNSKNTPFPLVYFTITIIDGPMSKGRRPPSYRKRRSHGARIYLMGLNMPTGYNQITEGTIIKASNAALVRTVNPQTTGPFVEFKIRVENKFGTSCKQMCLEPTSQRYKRCARRTVRLSTYPKFSDPIQYHETPTDAIDAQWTGRGYYKKRKFDYLLFRCD